MIICFSFCIEVAEEVLNLCSITNATKDGRIRPDSKDYQVVFNYEFLEDFVDERKSYFSWFWNGMRGYASILSTQMIYLFTLIYFVL